MPSRVPLKKKKKKNAYQKIVNHCTGTRKEIPEKRSVQKKIASRRKWQAKRGEGMPDNHVKKGDCLVHLLIFLKCDK